MRPQALVARTSIDSDLTIALTSAHIWVATAVLFIVALYFIEALTHLLALRGRTVQRILPGARVPADQRKAGAGELQAGTRRSRPTNNGNTMAGRPAWSRIAGAIGSMVLNHAPNFRRISAIEVRGAIMSASRPRNRDSGAISPYSLGSLPRQITAIPCKA